MKITFVFLALTIIFALSLIAPAFGQSGAPSGVPDVLIWIDARNAGASAVSITYPKVVPKAQAEADLANLLRETGWGAASVNITEGSVMKTGEFPMTSVEFMTPSVVQNDGILPVEPMARAFRNVKNIEVQYLTPATFYFRGWGNFENKYVKITLNRGNNSYRYSIRIKDAGFKSLGLPKLATQGNAGNDAVGRRSGVTLITTILIVMLALMAATLAYIFTARHTHRRQTFGGKDQRS